MNCQKCKNPIDDNATVCEWCGASVNLEEKQITSLDAELLSLLVNGEKQNAIKLYQERTGEPNKSICVQYIERLDFFRTHEFATEETWKKESFTQFQRKVQTGWLYFLLVFSVIMTLLGISWASSVIEGGPDLPEFGVYVTFIGVFLITLMSIIIKIRKK